MKMILGIDAGLSACGAALLTADGAMAWSATHRTSASGKKQGVRCADDAARRVCEHVRWLDHIAGHAVDLSAPRPPAGTIGLVVVELPSGGGQSAAAVRGMALATGYVVAWLACRGHPAVWVQPGDVKAIATGGRSGSKDAVMAAAVARWGAASLPATKAAREHAADAAWAAAYVLGSGDPLLALLR